MQVDDITLLLLYNYYIKMARCSDRKGGNKKKGKSIISRGIVNELELIPEDCSDSEEIQEEMEKSPHIEKTNEPQADDPPPQAEDLPDMEPCQKRKKVTAIILTDEQEL